MIFISIKHKTSKIQVSLLIYFVSFGINKSIKQYNTICGHYKVLNKGILYNSSSVAPTDARRSRIQVVRYHRINIVAEQQYQVHPKGYVSAFIVHFILHLVPMLFLIFDQVLVEFFQQKINAQLTILAIVFEFWFTKNITGKRMLGYRWFFAQDENGEERLFFECRANRQHIDWVKPKLFWLVQFAYCLITVLEIIETFFMIPNAPKIDVRKIQLCLLLEISGITNIFYFLRLSGHIIERQEVLHTRVGSDGLRKIGLGSIVSHY